MTDHDVYIQSLLVQYRVHRQELRTFTVAFIVVTILIPAAWVINHLGHQFRLGWMIATVTLVYGLAMATHCGNTLKVLRRITSRLNEEMPSNQRSFEYDQGKETDAVRYVVTLIGKIIAGLLMLWCFTPWPQL